MTDRENLKSRPNTAVPISFLHADVILCCGEDREELLDAVRSLFPLEVSSHHYRCYEFWRYPTFTLILTGIGTGCLEPLLWEILDRNTLGDRVARRLVAIGTAGFIGSDPSVLGQVFVIEAAYPAGCGVHLETSDLSVRANFQGLDRVSLPQAEGVATDYYYAFSRRTDLRIDAAQRADSALREGLRQQWKQGRLIDMETAQFYHLCRCYGEAHTQFVALRGVANLCDQFEQQGDNAPTVLTNAFAAAVQLLA
jgi:Phosphorylase superfamily